MLQEIAEGAHLENSFLFLAAGAEDLVALAEQLIHGVFVPDDVDGKRLQKEQGENSELSPTSSQPIYSVLLPKGPRKTQRKCPVAN